MIKKIFLLTIALLCAVAQGAWAESVTFRVRSWDSENKQVVTTNDTKDCIVLAGNPDEWMQLGDNDEADHYYVVTGKDVSYKTLNVFGKVHLILADGATLTLTGGLKVEKDNNAHLFIYSQSDGDSQGKLNVTNSYKRAAGIGSGEGWDCGEITIHGGKLDVTGGQYAAGIGAGGSYVNTTNTEGRSTNGGTTIVYGGDVTVHGGDSGAGIGGGAGYISPSSWTSDGGYFYLYGGTVTATGGEYAAGIGGGGGKRSVLSNRYGAGGKSSKVYVYGGNLTAKGGHRAAGIGGGNNGNGWNGGWDKDFELYVYNGTVNATGGDYGAGIGGGCNCNGGKVYIYDGNVTAKGGEDAAGIGGGEDGLGGELHVSGGTVRAEGTGCGAGIGGGEYTNQKGSSTQGTGANTYIIGGTVIAIAGGDCKARDAKGGSAIGAGQGVENKDDSDKAKVLEIPDNYMVTGGDAENNIERVFTNGERIDACRWRNYVKIEKCSHTKPSNGSDQTEAITYSIDDIYHTKHCRYCNYTVTEEHQGTECVCGKTSIYQFTVHHPGTEKDTYGESSTIAVGASMDFYLPSCKNVPKGYIFKGWEMNPAPNDVNRWAAVRGGDQSADTNMPAGTSVKVYLGQTPANFYARFLYDFTPTWSWGDNGSSASVTLSHKDLDDVTLSSTDDEPKVSIEQEVLKDEADNAIGTRHTATCTYAKNGYEYTFTDTYLLPVGDLVLHDAASNEDNLDTYHGKKVNTLTLHGRTLYADGKWNTLCLPFSLNATEVHTYLNPSALKTLSSSEYESGTSTLTLNFIDATTIDAGKPYLIKLTEGGNRTDLIFSNVTIFNDLNEVTTDYVTFAGFFSPVSLEANDKTVLYLGADNKLYWPSRDKTVNACRAVFVLNGLTAGDLPTPGKANARAFVLNFGDGEATGIVDAEADSSLFTLHSSLKEGWYDMQGRRLSGKPTARGIYINNGKKVVIK